MIQGRAALAWLLIRVTAGASLAFFHGYAKVFLGGAGGMVATLGNMGFPAPLVFAWAAALAEFAGGILVALGLATRYAALACAFTMAVALYRHLGDPVGRMELALLYFVLMVAAFLVGGGPYSLDQWIRVRFPLERK